MDKKEQIAHLIEALESVKKEPRFFIFERAYPIELFLIGFDTACHALELFAPSDHIDEGVEVERGWRLSATGLWRQMEEKGFDHDAILNEALTIAIEGWRRRLNKLENE